jgi:prepilin-type N-terminal cleavage/methylation domain-containing protein
MRARGFTLIELVAVIVILGVIAAVAVPSFLNLRKAARDASVRAQAAALHAGIENLRIRWRLAPGGGVAVQNLAGVGDGTWDFDDMGNLMGSSWSGSGDPTSVNCREIWNIALASRAQATVDGEAPMSQHGMNSLFAQDFGCAYILVDERGDGYGISTDTGWNVLYVGYDPTDTSSFGRGMVWSVMSDDSYLFHHPN